jgi:DCC1-like thiol-disulfide oxidoreductase
MEMMYYRRKHPDIFDMIDISDPSFDASKYNLTKQAVDKHLHLITAQGDLKIGVDAFIHIWSSLEGYQLLSKVVSFKPFYKIAKVGYEGFAFLRPWLPKKIK